MNHLAKNIATPGTSVLNAQSNGYTVDPKASLFTVHAFADGLIAAAAHNPQFAIRDFSAYLEFGINQLQNSSLALRIQSGHFDLVDDVSKDERRAIERVMNVEVLEAEIYPEISYRSRSISVNRLGEALFRAEIAGTLMLHGVERELGISAQIVLGDDTLRATGSFALHQSDFGIRIASVAGGTVKIKDQLRFSFYMVARRET
jgi:polyisoprenoid-binding protein YceI